ncbi:hypothetical protein BN890_55920 [Bacteroides xylanisolvens SD CC 1b]|uniref:Uncharacterized protein n=1 Tax=Bacteroides xylanisolvens SD CC 1b TaxID=702447 RepID=W6PDZ5_9BACE|nr:hypothetical protein BN890_27210 [Bacteroides xylanisolvens SD CC 1b]CDM07964.1 hypothetical protein BN890_55920 [Bacteroides xylanisolvens SD CC 1b]
MRRNLLIARLSDLRPDVLQFFFFHSALVATADTNTCM